MSASKSVGTNLEIWGGVECTVNRVGNSYYDQLERSGHALRTSDIDRLAELGVTKVRYPLLWERTAMKSPQSFDWSWADDRLARLRRLNLTPILGLLHHGSGPRYTSLLDPEFPVKVTAYASAVARRYPWVNYYTPINEPLTTARFSCLYGHWYPHAQDPLLFARAALAQVRAIVLAMRSIRAVKPDARLVQTEDIGKTVSSTTLKYQAEFENERRWLTYDLLAGKLTSEMPMWDYLRWVGIDEDELKWFQDNPELPDVLGINHYVTSERFLDERISRYPSELAGGNGRHRYADVEAVRVCAEGVSGPKGIIKEVWERYRLPVAITEAHLGCTREEQLRWGMEVWRAARELRNDNVAVRAVTFWSAFGAFDWNSLLTRNENSYEPGIFDLRSPKPRPTALAMMVKSLASSASYDHPVLDSPGWWRRLDRLCYPPVVHKEQRVPASLTGNSEYGEARRPIIITGATGTLGQAFARICERRGLAYYLLTRQDMDIAEQRSVEETLDDLQPWAVINAAGYVRVDDAEKEPDQCWRENVTGPANLGRACAERGIALVSFSSDLVFDGRKGDFYTESDAVSPLNVYGRSKAEAEDILMTRSPASLIIRTSAFFGPWDKANFVHAVLESLRKNLPFTAAANLTISPTYVPELVDTTLDLLIDNETGIWHVANSGSTTWAEFARLVATRAGYAPSLIKARPSHAMGLTAMRPSFSGLASERSNIMRALPDAVESYFAHTQPVELNKSRGADASGYE
jgi:dTDP-4-dehydrorhamnose reductase